MNIETSKFLSRFVVLKVFQLFLGSIFLIFKYYCIPRHVEGRELQLLNIFMLNKSLLLFAYVWCFKQLQMHHHKKTEERLLGRKLKLNGKKKVRNGDIKLFIDLGVVNCPVTHQSNFSCLLIISIP